MSHFLTAKWAQDSIKEGSLKHIIDTEMRDQISPKCLKEFARIADRCLHTHPKQRPSMAEVVVSLECVLALQERILQSGSRTLFGRMADMFPFTFNGENSGLVEKNAFSPPSPGGAVDKFKKQFSNLEENYGKGSTATPLERRQSLSLPRACILYPAAQSTVEVTNDLSVNESRNNQCLTISPQVTIQGRSGIVARPDKVGGSLRMRPGSSRPVIRIGRLESVPVKISHGS